MSHAPCFICFSCVRPLTPRHGAELEREASRAAEASRVEVQSWKEKAEGESHWLRPCLACFLLSLTPSRLSWRGLEKEASQVAEASVAAQAVLGAEIQEHNALQSAARTACEALEVGGGRVRQLPWEPLGRVERPHP